MHQAYTPALQVAHSAEVTKVRELPLPGRVLVAAGARVEAQTPVLSAELPGDITIIRVADRLGFEPDEIVPRMPLKPGDQVRAGELLCEVKSFFGLFRSRLESPVTGTVEFFTEGNAHLGIRQEARPLVVRAYIDGIVSAVEEQKSVTISSRAALIQGIFGVGGEAHGEILPLAVDETAAVDAAALRQAAADLAGKVVIGGSTFSADALAYAAGQKAAAVVTGSIDSAVLRIFVGRDISVSVTGDEEVPFTFIITEGFGRLPISTRITALARTFAGRRASVNGATQVRAGAMRPEVIIAHEEPAQAGSGGEELCGLAPGARVRVVRVPYFGLFGSVLDLPPLPQVVPSGALVRVLVVKLDDGREVMVPRANVELV